VNDGVKLQALRAYAESIHGPLWGWEEPSGKILVRVKSTLLDMYLMLAFLKLYEVSEMLPTQSDNQILIVKSQQERQVGSRSCHGRR
jgi:hypothetical protein